MFFIYLVTSGFILISLCLCYMFDILGLSKLSHLNLEGCAVTSACLEVISGFTFFPDRAPYCQCYFCINISLLVLRNPWGHFAWPLKGANNCIECNALCIFKQGDLVLGICGIVCVMNLFTTSRRFIKKKFHCQSLVFILCTLEFMPRRNMLC
jgi:hypothetical protein